MKRRSLFFTNIYTTLCLKMMAVLSVYLLARLCFYLFNTNYFTGLSMGEVLRIMVVGLRFDISSILILNAPFIFFSLLPFPFVFNRQYQKVIHIVLFYCVNLVALLLNFIDVVYFRFSLKRSTVDFLTYMNNEAIELFSLVPQYFRDFWLEILAFLVLSLLFIWICAFIKIRKPSTFRLGWRFVLLRMAGVMVVFLIVVVGIRGGLQLKPISIVTAGKYTPYKYTPLVLNTPFAIIKSINKQGVNQVNFFTEEEVAGIYTPIFNGHKITQDSSADKKNIVIIVMESFTAEYTQTLNAQYNGDYKGYTPFLDSLMQHGVYFRAFANGKRSIEAIPAIIAGIPALMNSDLMTSPFANNRIDGLPTLLKPLNYTSLFFHGGNNGTMNFDAFCKAAGFDSYFGRDEFNNDDYFDGKWGIFDEPFFQYFAQKLENTPEPFLAVFFSLSSHHPYTIPQKHKDKFDKGTLDIHESIMYADYSLSQFFKTAQRMPWYANTLFVITADHTAETYYLENQNRIGRYEIPLLFFSPGNNTTGFRDITAQQCDIGPTLINWLGYKLDFVTFGNNLLDSDEMHFAVNYLNGTYYLIRGGYALSFDGGKSTGLFDIKNDRMLSNNLIHEFVGKTQQMELLLKAIIQQYNNRMIGNKLSAQ